MKSLVRALAGVLAVAALALAPPALAQDKGGSGGGGGGDRGGGGGGGHAGGGAGGANVSGGGGFSGGSSGGSTGGFSGGSSSGGSGGGSGYSGGGGTFSPNSPNYTGPSPMGAGVRHMATSERGRGPGTGGAAVAREGGRMGLAAGEAANASVPAGSRTNYGHPVVGTAVERGTARQPSGGGSYSPGYSSSNNFWDRNGWFGSYYPSSPYFYFDCVSYGAGLYTWGPCASRYGYMPPFDPSSLYGYGAFGMGAYYYDPMWWGSAYGASGAYYGGGYYGGGYNGGGYYGGGYYGGGYSGGYSSSARDRSEPSGPKGGLKLKVSPSQAEVYVDGYYIGKVDDYNGAFQRLQLPLGTHRVELRSKGYQPISFEVNIEPRDTITYHGAMQPLQPVK